MQLNELIRDTVTDLDYIKTKMNQALEAEDFNEAAVLKGFRERIAVEQEQKEMEKAREVERQKEADKARDRIIQLLAELQKATGGESPQLKNCKPQTLFQCEGLLRRVSDLMQVPVEDSTTDSEMSSTESEED